LSAGPDSISGIVFWLAARLETGYSNNDAVSALVDQSGNGHNGAKGDGNTLTYKTGVINSQPAYYLGSAWITMGNLSSLFPDAATLFMVAAISDTEYRLYNTGVSDEFWRWAGDGNGYVGAFRSSRINSYPATMPSSGNHLLVLKSTTGTGTYEIILDGSSKGTKDTTHTGGGTHTIGNTLLLAGHVAEVIAYDKVLASGELALVQSYLNNIYAIY